MPIHRTPPPQALPTAPNRRGPSVAKPPAPAHEGPSSTPPRTPRPQPAFSGLRRAERELVVGLRAGRIEAFEALDREYRDRVRRFAWKRLRDPAEAEDVCQDVFLDVHRSIASFEGRSSFTTWLFGIAHHQVHRRFRRRGRDAVSLDAENAPELADDPPRIEDRIDAARAIDRLDCALERSVAPRHREIFRLRYAHGCATREIARQVGRSNQSVKISLFRTRRLLEGASPLLAESSAYCG